MQYLKISLYSQYGYEGGYTDTMDNIEVLKDMFSELSEGEYIKLEPIELTEAEFEALPEFEGF